MAIHEYTLFTTVLKAIWKKKRVDAFSFFYKTIKPLRCKGFISMESKSQQVTCSIIVGY
jgi:hypothetical protein